MNPPLKDSLPKYGQETKPPGGRRINWYWIYLFILILLLLSTVFTRTGVVKEITWQQFENEILSKKAVEKLVVTNGESVEVYLKSQFEKDPKFKDAFKKSFGGGTTGPQYTFNIGSVESFERKVDDAQKTFSPTEKISITYAKKSNWFCCCPNE